jgi:hypothetical protein
MKFHPDFKNSQLHEPAQSHDALTDLISVPTFSITHTTIVNSLIMTVTVSSSLYGDALPIKEMLNIHQISC